MSFPRYPKYKPSGVEWLGEVPEHWEIWQSRRLFSLRTERAYVDDEQLTASQKHGVIPQKLFMEIEDQRVVQVLLNSEILKHVEQGDFVISMRSFQGGIEYASHRGCISSAYVMLVPTAHIEGAFFKYLFKSLTYIQALQSTTNLVRDGQALRFQNFCLVPLPRIPIAEQLAIATFLDRETSKIDALVGEQRRLIELLKEKRQAVISHAVTKGLNPHAPMKPSGIEWLGDVPEHWEVAPLKYLVTLSSGGTPSKEVSRYWNGNVPWASSKDLKSAELHDTQDHITEMAIEDGVADLVPYGSILTVVRGMILLHSFPVVVTRVPMAINQDLKAITARSRYDSNYLAWLLRGASSAILGITDEAAHGTKVLRMDSWLAMQFPVPPIGEQQEIVAKLIKKLIKLDALTAEAERAIELLQERRTALISAAVTGKIDVRSLDNVEVVA